MRQFRVSALFTLALEVVHGANRTSAGLAWPNGLWVPMAGFNSPNTSISSYYTWSPDPVIPPNASSPLDDVPFPFIPMLWGCNSTYTEPWSSAVENNFQGVNLTSDRAILGFNEPNIEGQSNCSPEEAAQAWKTYLEPLRDQGYRLGSPAVTSGQSGSDWFSSWLEACDGDCNFDFITLHWYDIDPQSFITFVKSDHLTYDKPVWITEYAVQNFTFANSSTVDPNSQATLPEIEIFMDVSRDYMESYDWIERYFWFGAMYDMQGLNPLNSLFLDSGAADRTGALSALGVQYAQSNGSMACPVQKAGFALRTLKFSRHMALAMAVVIWSPRGPLMYSLLV